MGQNWETSNKRSLNGQLIFEKGGRRYNGVKIASSINGVGKTELVHAKKWN